MVDEELRTKVIARAKEKVRNMRPLAILEAVTLIDYIEELEAAQQSAQAGGALVCPCPYCLGKGCEHCKDGILHLPPSL